MEVWKPWGGGTDRGMTAAYYHRPLMIGHNSVLHPLPRSCHAGAVESRVAELDPSLSPDVRAVADRVRSFFRDSFPEIEERVYAGAKSVGYRTAEAGTICGLFVRGAHVHLVFTRGSQVPDPSHLLRGDGEGVRYITFRKWSDVDEESLYPLVVAALLVGGGAADGIQPPLP